MLLKQALLLFLTISYIRAKVYDRCELAYELKDVYKFPGHEIPTWICIVAHESIYDTAAMNPGSGDHGLFQISQLFWCSPPGDGFGCNAPCDNFRDDNIADDVECIRRIYKEHSRISGDGFNAWVVYPLYCKGDTSRYIRGCFDNEVDSGLNEILNNTISTEKPVDEDDDDDGYEFPPLPSPPKKSAENIISGDDDVYEFPPLPTTFVNVTSTAEPTLQERQSLITQNPIKKLTTVTVRSETPITKINIMKKITLLAVKPVSNTVSSTAKSITKTPPTTSHSGEKLTTIYKSDLATSKPTFLESRANLNSVTDKNVIKESTINPISLTIRNKQSTARQTYISSTTRSPKQLTYKPFVQNPEIIFTLKPALGPLRPITPSVKPPTVRPPRPLLSNRPFSDIKTSTTRLPLTKRPILRPPFKESKPQLNQNLELSTTTLDTSSSQKHITTLFFKSTSVTPPRVSTQKSTTALIKKELSSTTSKPLPITKKDVDKGIFSTTSKSRGFQKHSQEHSVEKTTHSTTSRPLSSQKPFPTRDTYSKFKSSSINPTTKSSTTLSPLFNRNSLKREEQKYNDEFPGAPILMSFPHLLYADREYTSSVKGLKPNREQHETFVTLEPISGFPLQLAQRVQMNMFIRPIEEVSSMENVSKALVPLLWIEESTVLGDEYIDMLQNKLLRGLKIFNIVKWVVMGIGFTALIISFFLFIYIKAP